MSKFLLIWLLCVPLLMVSQSIKTPAEFLNTDYGNHITPHHLIVDYMHYVASNSSFATIENYGFTNEDRPLVMLTISTPENLENIEEIRKKHQESLRGNGDEDKVIVWLSFGVHGNEAGATESSLQILHNLASGEKEVIEEWLQNTIIIMDPCLNPDGFSRYSHWVRGVATEELQPEVFTREHFEPWPQGRVNHYLFDLNRDWAWATQVETQQRIPKYNEWLPHIHVDYHEMGHNSHYYFAPAAKPYNQNITEWQAEFQKEIGRNHASYFDEEGWLFFTREVFDLLYPSYGDTYPMFNGAIGMTYEQAGNSRAGRAIHLENHDTLTIQDRIDHHRKTALSTIEISSLNANRLISQMKDYYKQENNSEYESYIISRDEYENFDELCRIMDLHGIEYGQANRESQTKGYHYRSGENTSFDIKAGDLVIPTNQFKSVLVNTLFEPHSMVEDSITYDITSWALPFAHGLNACASESMVDYDKFEVYQSESKDIGDCTAVAISYSGSNGPAILAALLNNDIQCRVNYTSIHYESQKIDKGSIIITQADNRKNKNWRKVTRRLAESLNVHLIPIQSSFPIQGPDLGSSSLQFLEKKRIGTFVDENVSANSFGQLWHFFENDINYPLLIFNKVNLSVNVLDELDVLILQEGSYSLTKEDFSLIKSWVSKGGKLITLGSASHKFMNKEGFSLKESEKEKEEQDPKISNLATEEREYISKSIPGAIIETQMDRSHPISYGLGEKYFTLRTSSRSIPMQKKIRNAVVVPEKYEYYGFIGDKAKKAMESSMVVGIERMGQGSIVYFADNPVYRGFWKAGAKMLANALFLVEK